jgi:hypothetical protein
MTHAIELAYGLLWIAGFDRSAKDGSALYLARNALYEQLDKEGQSRGIAAARQAVNQSLDETSQFLAEVQMRNALQAWLSCPADKRPSPQALGELISEIATQLPS